MAPLHPSEPFAPHAMKSTDPPEPHLHIVHVHAMTPRHNGPWAITKTDDCCPPHQKVNQVFSNI
jgi:hypothetical protein